MNREHIRKVLIALAERMCDNPLEYSDAFGRDVDRALRLCLTDIDPTWVRWSYVGQQHGWITARRAASTIRARGQPQDTDNPSF